MSNEIDWSKAPEGATHYNSELPWPWLLDGDVPAYFADGKWIVYEHKSSGYARIKDAVRIPTNVEWNGTGLPPAGTVCEVDYCEQWHKCEVIAHFQQRVGMVAAFTVDMGYGAKALDAFGAEYFRPIRTPEQIAAEEREKAVAEMKRIWSEAESSPFYAIYDAGYRKTEGWK